MPQFTIKRFDYCGIESILLVNDFDEDENLAYHVVEKIDTRRPRDDIILPDHEVFPPTNEGRDAAWARFAELVKARL
jgi:hypothetical protein